MQWFVLPARTLCHLLAIPRSQNKATAGTERHGKLSQARLAGQGAPTASAGVRCRHASGSALPTSSCLQHIDAGVFPSRLQFLLSSLK